MSFKTVLIILNVFLFMPRSQAATTAEVPAEVINGGPQKTTYWVPQKPDQLKAKVGISIPRYSVQMISENGTKANFEPNANSKIFLTLGYRNLAATLSTTNSQSADETTAKGSSDGTDFQLRFYGKKTLELFYQSYGGYYLDNSSELDVSYENTSNKIIYPDMKTQNYGLNLFWNMNDDKISYAAAFDQAGHQLEDALGWNWFGHASQSKISNANRPFVPASSSAKFGSLANINDISRVTFAGGLGGAVIFVFREKFYATGLLALGVGYQDAQLSSTIGDTIQKQNLEAYSTLRMGLGYNGQSHVVGLQVIAERVNSKIGDNEIGGILAEFSLGYSYRFDSISLPPLDTVSSWLD